MAGLQQKKIKDSYKSLLRVDDDTHGIDGSLANITDGEGTIGPFQISSTEVAFPASSTLKVSTIKANSATEGFHLNLTDSNTNNLNLLSIPDDRDGAFIIQEGSNQYMKFTTTNGSEIVEFGKDVEMQGNLQVNGTIVGSSIDFNSVDMTNVDIDSGTIDGVSIDGSAIGAGGASTGAFTTLTASGDVTISNKIVHSGDTDTYTSFGTDSYSIYLGGTQAVEFIYNNIYIKQNNTGVIGYTTGASSLNLIKVNSSDKIEIGESSNDIVLNTTGSVGIGIASPSAGAVGGKVLHLQNSGATASVRVDRSDASTAGTLSITSGNTSNSLFSTGSKDLTIATNSTTALTIDSSQRLGIGTTSPKSVLHASDGTASGITARDDAIIITHSANPKLVFEDASEGSGDKVMLFNYFDETLHISSMTDDMTGWDNIYIASFNRDGNVGINENQPITKLDVRLDSTNTSLTSDYALFINNETGAVVDRHASIGFGTYNNGGLTNVIGAVAEGTGAQSGLYFATHNGGTLTEKVRIANDGKVGIGTTSPTDVKGLHIKSNEDSDFPLLKLESDSTVRDASIVLINDGGNTFTIGIDASDSDKFKISDNAQVGVNDRIVIDSSGNVGIGETSPSASLHIKNTGGTSYGQFVTIEGDTTDNNNYSGISFKAGTLANAYPEIGVTNGGLAYQISGGYHSSNYNNRTRIVLQGSDGSIQFLTGGDPATERMRITSNGDIELATDETHIHMNTSDGSDNKSWSICGGGGDSTQRGSLIHLCGNEDSNDGKLHLYAGNASNNNGMIHFYTGNSVHVGKFDYNGDFYSNDGTIHNLSDKRGKKDIKDLSDGLDIVKKLKPVTYKWNGKADMGEDDDVTRYGFVADDVLEVASQYVGTTKAKLDGEDVDDYKTISMLKMFPMLVKAVQELSAKVEALENA